MDAPTYSEVKALAEARLIEVTALLCESETRTFPSCYHKSYMVEIIVLKLALEALKNDPILPIT